FTIDEYPVYVKAGSILPYYGKLKNLSGTEQDVIVRIFPGGKERSFELYEDNGNDCDYATQYATTALSYKRDGNKLLMTIAARKGSYPQMPANRRYHLALPCALAPACIRLDGQPTAYTYDGYALETQADLGLLDCSRNHVVEVEYTDADATVADGTKARMAHITKTVADYKQQNAGMVYTDAVGYLEATPLRLTYFPKEQAQTLKQFNAYYADLPNVLREQMGDHPQSAWHPAGKRLKSAFTEQVNPANPLPEYPRPILTREVWQSLNGLWNYAIVSEDALCPTAYDGQILVPYPLESSLSGVQRKMRRDQVLWYERTFSVPKSWQGRDVLLHFGAVDHEAIVYVNGQRVASHVGGYTAFSVNITSALHEGDNRLTVRVIDHTEDRLQPVGKQRLNPGGNGSIWYTSVSGIWQTVWMEPVAKQHITDIRTTPDLDASRFAIDVKTVGTNPSTDKVEVTLSYDGHMIVQGSAPAGQTIFLPLKNPQLWTPDSPNRYQMSVRLMSNGQQVDQIGSYAAMRKISVAQQADGIWRLQLNNKNLFHFGPLDQGYWPDGLYTAPTDEALRFDIQKTKDWGFNMIRKHMKVEPARWYYYCDSIGILVWQDMPSVCRSDQHWDSRGWNRQMDGGHAAGVEVNYFHEWGEIINEFYSYPCIVVWTPFNEAWGQFKTPEVVEFTRQQDPTRLINPASGGNHYHAGDFLDLHDYGRPPQLFLNDATRPVVLGEYGGLGRHVEGHRWVESDATTYVNYKDADELTDSYVEQGEAVLRMAKGIQLQDGTRAAFSAAVYTQNTDVETEVNGLMTYDRKVMKMDETRIRAINSAIAHSLDK
ncbi:MAG: sugar-binding domain-containing protein, partial [Prevotella sp.]